MARCVASPSAKLLVRGPRWIYVGRGLHGAVCLCVVPFWGNDMREEMIAMAREAGCVEPSHPFNPWSVSQEALERFKALVSAAERERCAKVCDEMEKSADGTDCCKWPTPSDCAYTIRKGE